MALIILVTKLPILIVIMLHLFLFAGVMSESCMIEVKARESLNKVI